MLIKKNKVIVFLILCLYANIFCTTKSKQENFNPCLLYEFQVYPNKRVLCEENSFLPLNRSCTFINETNADIIYEDFYGGALKEHRQLTKDGDTIEFIRYGRSGIELYVQENTDTITRLVPPTNSDTILIDDFAICFLKQKFTQLNNKFIGQIGELDFEKIYNSAFDLIGRIKKYDYLFIEKRYDKGTKYNMSVYSKICFYSDIDTLVANLLINFDDGNRNIISITFDPKKVNFLKYFLEMNIDKKIPLTENIFIDSNVYRTEIGSLLPQMNEKSSYLHNGIVIMQLSFADYVESVTVSEKDRTYVIHIYYKKNDYGYSLVSKQIFFPKMYMPIWFINK